MTPDNDVIFDGLASVLASGIPVEAKLFFASLLTVKSFRQGWLISHSSFDEEQKREAIGHLEEGGWVQLRREANGFSGLGLGAWAFAGLETLTRHESEGRCPNG